MHQQLASMSYYKLLENWWEKRLYRCAIISSKRQESNQQGLYYSIPIFPSLQTLGDPRIESPSTLTHTTQHETEIPKDRMLAISVVQQQANQIVRCIETFAPNPWNWEISNP